MIAWNPLPTNLKPIATLPAYMVIIMHALAGFASKVSTGSIAALPDEICMMSLLFSNNNYYSQNFSGPR